MNLPQPGMDLLPFEGGYDTETSPWSVPGGRVRAALNYELALEGGYRDVAGYERFDGRTSPSAAVYAILECTITGTFPVGSTVTQLTSGATGVVIAVSTSTSPQYLVLTKITGTFDATNALQVGAVTEGTASSAALEGGASTAALHATYLNLAADQYRADIGAPSGSGAILGVWNLNGTWYCARNNAGGTAAAIWKESGSGWTAVALGRQVSFTSGGAYEIQEGNTITGATSGATAVITRVVLTSGSWAGGDAAGKVVFASQTGTFQAENLNVGANLNVATIAGNSSAITLLPDGRFETVNHSFSGSTSLRTYGCDSVNKGFEFDGTVWVPIDTGMTTDAPTHVAVHKKHLFFSFGPSVQHSGIGAPYSWDPITGAAELSLGEATTAMRTEPGDGTNASLVVYGRNRIHVIYGNSSADWNMVQYREEVGALAYTVAQLGQTVFMDDRGVMNLRTAQEYGNFQDASLSTHIQSWLDEHEGLAVASCLVRKKAQYRVFFSDNYALYVTLSGGKVRGMMPVLLNTDVACCYSCEMSDGSEEIMFGSSDGYVYQMERGTSFDGDPIDAVVTLHFHHCKSLRVIKKFLSATLEARGSGYAAYAFAHELSYTSENKAQPESGIGSVSFRTVDWDEGQWDSGYWDGLTLTPTRHRLSGSGENISITISKSSDEYPPITFSGALIRFLPRRGIR